MCPLGVGADGLYDAIHADVTGQLEDGLDRFLLVEVDHLGPLRPGHLQPRLVLVDGDDPTRAHDPGARYGELADGTATEDRDRVPVFDIGDIRAEVGGREDVGDHGRLLVGDCSGSLTAMALA